MSEHDTDPIDPNAAAPVTPDTPPAPTPAVETKPRWRDRAFRMRAVAAVAVAGVILGATGGAVTTALVSDHGHDGPGEHRIRQMYLPGMPAVPPDGRMRFPGDESDGQRPDLPVPPGMNDDSEDGTDDGSENGTEDGTDEPSGLSQS